MKRAFLPSNLKIESWTDVKPYFEQLENRTIQSVDQLKHWWLHRSELECVLEEEMAWRYIKMNCDTNDEQAIQRFEYFVTEIEPQVSLYSDTLNKKLIATKQVAQLEKQGFEIPLRSIRNHIEIFRTENVPILAELQTQEQEYGKIAAAMTISYNNKELTLQQAANYLKDTSRQVRSEVYALIAERRYADHEALHDLLSQLIQKRHQVALNAGFSNYRDYKFKDLGRFDYNVADCEQFHASVAAEVRPVVEAIHRSRQQKLQLDKLKPWDLEVDTDNLPAIKPFESAHELVQKTIACFGDINPQFAKYIETMHQGGFLDLESRKGKAPGGFNYPLYESSIPFIYMNAAGNMNDVETMVHEGGHAIHSFLTANLQPVDFKNLPSEIAELASMSMELISMEHWQHFVADQHELRRARRAQLEGIAETLTWVATIDKFQHWLYANPQHDYNKRTEAWLSIANEFGSAVINRDGQEKYWQTFWQKQLHIYEVPFYYIEYGIAQLGALGVWRNYKQNPTKAIADYQKALSLGYTVSIPEVYRAAGVPFDFSRAYIAELMQFLQKELQAIDN